MIFLAQIKIMKSISELLKRNGIGVNHPDYELLSELIVLVVELKKSVEPFISNDPTKHRVNLMLRGKVFPFLVCQDDEYYLRIAAKLINEKNTK